MFDSESWYPVHWLRSSLQAYLTASADRSDIANVVRIQRPIGATLFVTLNPGIAHQTQVHGVIYWLVFIHQEAFANPAVCLRACYSERLHTRVN